MGNELPVEIQNKIDIAAQQYESATQHYGLGPAIFKAGVDYALAYAKVMANKELQAQAQRMADALEEIAKEANNSPEDTWGEIAVRMKRIAIMQLQQFKDGKGKESVVGKCTKCGRHYPHANESGMCNKCGREEVGE